MREFLIEKGLKRKLKKIVKPLYNSTIKKFEDILNSKDIDHYKNLKKPLQNFKRVHIKGSFVLIFKYLEQEDKILFYELDHHDNIY